MFEWKPEYSVQIPEIDAQHKRLFALAAELHAALTQSKGHSVLEQSLASLVDYTQEHFATEERLMGDYAYPEVVGHKAEHEKLTAQVLELQRRFRSGETKLSLNLMIFVKNWLENHIAGSDQKYSVFIRGKRAA